MTPDDLAIRPAATRAEAAAIAAAIHAHERRRDAERAEPEAGWRGRRWRLAARLEAVGRDTDVRSLGNASPWRAAGRTDR